MLRITQDDLPSRTKSMFLAFTCGMCPYVWGAYEAVKNS